MRATERSTVTTRAARCMLAIVALVLLLFVAADSAAADVSVSRAEVSAGNLRIEGTATASRAITVDGVVMATSDSGGRFKVDRSGYTPPADCTVDVNDSSPTPRVATLSGCSVSSSPPPPPPPPASAASLSAVAVRPSDVIGGDPATGTVTLTTAAPAGGLVVALSSDNTAAATVPASVTVAAGATSASFPVTTNSVPNSQSALVIGTLAGVQKYAIITVWTPFAYANGSISILPGGNGSGRVTSTPAGIDCTIVRGNGAAGSTCTAFFPVGTVVRLDARPAADSSFQGWRSLPGCFDASRVTVARGTNITCQPGFSLR